MAAKTLYDILELSSSASTEAIRAAYERLIAKYDPDRSENLSNPNARFQQEAVKEAFLTLSNPAKRAHYDKTAAQAQPKIYNVEVIEPFWTVPKILILAVVLLIGGGAYYKHKQVETRAAAERAIAEAKAKEAAEHARLEAEQARLALQREREEKMEQARARRDADMTIRQLSTERRVYTTIDQSAARRDAMDQRRLESQRQNEEKRAAYAAQQRVEREKAELCRLERERYGKSVSC
jgi:curved DNA-binding protein CbpA